MKTHIFKAIIDCIKGSVPRWVDREKEPFLHLTTCWFWLSILVFLYNIVSVSESDILRIVIAFTSREVWHLVNFLMLVFFVHYYKYQYNRFRGTISRVDKIITTEEFIFDLNEDELAERAKKEFNDLEELKQHHGYSKPKTS